MDEAFSFGERELDVMMVLWRTGAGTVAEVRDALPVPLAYTTVLTILRNLESKGYLRREAVGRAHRYSPAIAQQEAQTGAVRRLLGNFFQGSATALLAELAASEQITPQDLHDLAAMLRRAQSHPKEPTDA